VAAALAVSGLRVINHGQTLQALPFLLQLLDKLIKLLLLEMLKFEFIN
jgi:hypothetical protein